MIPVEPVVLPPCFLLHGTHGCDRHPAFPAPSCLVRGCKITQSSGTPCREDVGLCLQGCLKCEPLISQLVIASGATCPPSLFELRRTRGRLAPRNDET